MKRNTTIEILRFLFIYLIVVTHVFIHGNNLEYSSVYTLGANLLTSFHFEVVMLGKIGVIGFVFISGYYGIKLNIGKIVDIVLIVLFYLIFLQVLAKRPAEEILFYIFRPFEQWWFIRYYLVLMLLSPILNEGWRLVNEKQRHFIVMALLYVFCFAMFLGRNDSHDLTIMVVCYLTGRYVHDAVFNRKCLYFLSILSLILYLLIATLLANFESPYHYLDIWYSHNNILLIIFVAGMVLWADKHQFRIPFVNQIASSILAIYLITDYGHLRSWNHIMLPYMFNGIGYLWCFFICIACIFVDRVRAIMFNSMASLITFSRKRTIQN